MADVIHSRWGYYYPYQDENGKDKGLKIFDWVYDKYYKPGYLTNQMIDEMLLGKTIKFTTNTETISAKIIPYTIKAGKATQIIQFDSEDKTDDKTVIMANAEKIVVSYYNKNRYDYFDYEKPQAEVDKLPLKQQWRTRSTKGGVFDNKHYGIVKVYRPKVRNDEGITLYCEVDINNDSCIMITEEQYKAAQQRAKEEQDARPTSIDDKPIKKSFSILTIILTFLFLFTCIDGILLCFIPSIIFYYIWKLVPFFMLIAFIILLCTLIMHKKYNIYEFKLVVIINMLIILLPIIIWIISRFVLTSYNWQWKANFDWRMYSSHYEWHGDHFCPVLNFDPDILLYYIK